MTAEHKKIAELAFRHDHRDVVYIVANRGYMDYGIALQQAGNPERVTTIRRQELPDEQKPAKPETKKAAEAEKAPAANQPETPNAE